MEKEKKNSGKKRTREEVPEGQCSPDTTSTT